MLIVTLCDKNTNIGYFRILKMVNRERRKTSLDTKLAANWWRNGTEHVIVTDKNTNIGYFRTLNMVNSDKMSHTVKLFLFKMSFDNCSTLNSILLILSSKDIFKSFMSSSCVCTLWKSCIPNTSQRRKELIVRSPCLDLFLQIIIGCTHSLNIIMIIIIVTITLRIAGI